MIYLELYEIIALVGVVALAGFVDAIAGGGGILSLPAYFAVGLPPHAALATNKFSSCLGTLVAAIRFFRAGKVHMKVGLLATAGALAGSACGTRLALGLTENTVHDVVLVLIPVVAAMFLLKDRLFARRKVKEPVPLSASTTALRAFGTGALIGCYDGFFGPGTGTFLGIAFHLGLRMDLVSASGNARLTNLASNAGSLVVFLLSGKVLFPLALLTAAGGIAGNTIGAGLAVRKGAKIIRPLMVVMLCLLLAYVVRQRFD